MSLHGLEIRARAPARLSSDANGEAVVPRWQGTRRRLFL